MQGQKCYQAWRQDQPCNNCPVDLAIQDGKNHRAELNPENQEHWSDDQGYWHITADPVKDDQGNIVGAIEIAQDVTEQKQIIAEKEKMHQNYESIINSLNEIVYEHLVKEDTINWSGATEEMLGYKNSEMGNNEKSWKEKIHPDDLSGVEKKFERAQKKNQLLNVEYRCQHKNGNYLWFHDRGVMRLDNKGELQSVVGIMENVNARKHKEELNRALNQAALEAEKSFTENAIFGDVANKLKELGVESIIFLLNKDKNTIYPAYISTDKQELKAAEKLTGIKASDIEISLADTKIYRKTVSDRRTIYLEFEEQVKDFQKVLPEAAKQHADKIIKHLNFHNMIISPLIITDEVVGVYSISSEDISAKDKPMVSSFANLIAAGLHKTRLFRKAQNEIEERKQKEKELQKSKDKFKNYIENAPSGIYISDLEGNIIFVNEVTGKLTGYSQDQLLEMNWREIIYTEDKAKAKELFENLLEKRTISSELRFVGKENKVRFGLVKAVRLGENRLLCFIDDITNRKKAEQQVIQSQKEYHTIFENTGTAIVTINVDFTISFTNKQFEKLSGYDREEIEGKKSINNFFDIKDRRKFKKYYNKHLTGNQSVQDQQEFKFKDRDGNFRNVLVTLARVTGKDQCIASFLDITERKGLEKDLRQAQKMESLGRLAGGIAHDMNNLLSPIMGYSQMLKKIVADDKRIEKYVNSIHKAGQSAQDLVRQLLSFSRKQDIKLEPIDLNSVIKDFKKLLQKAIHEDVEIKYNLAESLPEIIADKGQIEQIIMNIAVNADDAMPAGGTLTIETRVTDLDDKYTATYDDFKTGKHATIIINDTGQGIDAEIRKKIFDPFFSTKGEHGTGMGLSTVYGIVKQNNGDIHVYSEPEQGTTFKVYLPVTKRSSVKEREREKDKTKDPGGSETVLVAEDNQESLELIREVLELKGYQVIMAENGKEALEKLKEHKVTPDLLLADVIMPELNGKELYQKLIKKYPDLKVIYMSGYTNGVISQKGILKESISFIQKPYNVDKLARKVRTVLDQ